MQRGLYCGLCFMLVVTALLLARSLEDQSPYDAVIGAEEAALASDDLSGSLSSVLLNEHF